MKRFIVLFALIAALSSVAMANGLCVSGNTFQSYQTNYSTFSNACVIGDKLFWGFNLSAGWGSLGFEPTASGITVGTFPGDGFTDIGISFNSSGWVADPGFPIDAIITYNVATLSGSTVIKDATLTITGTLTGAGDVGSVVETLTPAVLGSPLTTTLPAPVSVNIDFSSNKQQSLFVKDEIILHVDPRNTTTAHISIVENNFSEAVPEPVMPVLIGSGLLLFACGWKRQAKTRGVN